MATGVGGLSVGFVTDVFVGAGYGQWSPLNFTSEDIRVAEFAISWRLLTYKSAEELLWWAVQDSNLRPPACKAGALTG